MLEESTVTQKNTEAQGAVFDEPEVLLPALLLHSCCGPCSASVVEQLATRFRLTLYFCNSNIDDEEEYQRRLTAQRDFTERYNLTFSAGEPITLICAEYEPDAFKALVKGKEGCPEGGERCRLCIHDRLERTAEYAAMNGYEFFSSTLTVSRHKDYEMILHSGKQLAVKYRLSFIEDDYKKDGGELRSAELAKEYGLYRQNYCGCSFSKR